MRWNRRACLGLFVWLAPVVAASQPSSDDGVVRFVYPDTTAKQVSLAGDFNGWSPSATPLDREDDVWMTRVFLDAGTYEYKFMVDGAWRTDPANPETSAAGNSVVRVASDGSVLPPQAPPAAADSAAAPAPAGALSWQLRYLGFVTARRDHDLDRFDLDRPVHDVDLRFDARLTPDASAWFLLHADNRTDAATVRYDRGLLQWRPGSFTVRVFDNVGVTEFDDPGVLVGRVGRYADSFGYERLGAHVRRRILGAPFELVYADNSEPTVNRAPETALPDLHVPEAGLLVGQTTTHYAAAASDHGADALALRGRLGTDRIGMGLGLRFDRGANAGRVAELDVQRLPGDTLVATGQEYRTTESWNAWAIDVRGGIGAMQAGIEYMAGTNRAQASESASIVRMRAAPGGMFTERELGTPHGSSAAFDLDTSRRVVVSVRGPEPGTAAALVEPWSARPGTGELGAARVGYDYEEHDFSGLTTGAPFLMRRHGVRAGADLRRGDTVVRLDVEHDWFRYPDAASWATQFWLRSGSFWLDEDIVGLDRITLLGTQSAALVRLHAGSVLWPAREVRAESHTTWAAPGFDHAPRLVEEILRVAVPVAARLEIRGHARLAVYRRFEPADAAGMARFGTGARIEAGDIDLTGVAVDTSYRLFDAYFLECVYAFSRRADLALGFGVDPFIVYETTNEYAPVGWDEFVFDRGLNDLVSDPANLGRRLDDAERALERERRLGLEVRLRF